MIRIFSLLLFLAFGQFAIGSATSSDPLARPNILLILADDLGFSDLGCYGGEIATPNIDKLAGEGLRFTQFYNTARCWPTRSAMLSGYYAQHIRRDEIPGVPKTGSQGKRQDWAPLLPKLLTPAGYRSYHSGKWHIDGMPIAEGFDRSYYLKDQGRFFNPQKHWLDDQPLPPVEKDTGFYATTALADHAIKVLEEHSQKHADQPFFHYLAFAAPHFPLHALPEDIAKYENTYTEGWTEIRSRRHDQIKKLGLSQSGLSAIEPDLGPPYHFADALEILGSDEVNRPLPWDTLSTSQQAFQSRKMAIHAAMIDRMDQEIGRVIAQIEKMGQRENTLIIFLSDNGASAEIMVRADGHDPEVPLGSAGSYLCLGPGWSSTCNTPFRRHKTWTHEGGIATPFVISWPAGIANGGSFRKTPAHVIDLLPTFLSLAGLEMKDTTAPPHPGKNLLPAINADTEIERESLWWLHEGHKAIRIKDWKLVAAKGDPWALYNLSTDRAESNDLSKVEPERVREMAAIWQRQLEAFRSAATANADRL